MWSGGHPPRCRRRLYRRTAVRSKSRGGQLRSGHRRALRLRPPLRRKGLRDAQHHSLGRRTPRGGGAHRGTLPRGGRCAHRAGPRATQATAAAHRAPRLDADGQLHARKGAVARGGWLPPDCFGPRNESGPDTTHRRCGQCAARGLRPRRALRELQRTLLRFAALLRPLGQPRPLRTVLPPGLRPRGRGGTQTHQGTAPALAARHEPHRAARGDDGRRGALVQD